MARTRRRNGSADDGEEEEREAKEKVNEAALGSKGRRERRGSNSDGG
uniref:Uncharacterized protein n=1 Tax=Arundo donax TaxID=35708 RepID=A0A0A8Y1B2_ARUDO